MPTSRTMHAKSPRSSAVTPTPSNLSTPKFMPPSHYAAAGGYTPRRITNKDVFSQGDARRYGRSPGTTTYSGGVSSRKSVVVHTPSDSEQSMPSSLDDHVPDITGLKNGYPQLEAQLLPSLRDTIDRMTGGSSRVPSPRATGITARNLGTTTKGLTRPWNTPTVSQIHDHGISAEQQYDKSSISKLGATQETSSRLKTPTKSALKSSLRSPSTKTSRTTSGTPTLPPSFHTVSPSPLKSMKTLLTRKCSGKLRSPFNGHKAILDPPEKSLRNEHSSSQHESLESMSSRSRTSRSDHQSNIPRLRTRFHDIVRNNDDSDFEHRFELESRERRKLTVTNAEVLVSESSSGSSAEFRHDSTLNSRTAEMPRTKYADSSRSVGLGLSFPKTTPSISPKTSNEEENRQYLNSEKNLRFSLPPSNSGESIYSDDFDNYDAFNAKNGQSRGQGSYVSGDTDLDFEYHHPTRSTFLRHHDKVRENGTACLLNPSHRSLSQSPPNDRQDMQHARDVRRRSSSCGPSYRASPQEANCDLYNDPVPRSRSSCLRYAAQVEHTSDTEFPQSLKDLIKHRNSFSKPPVYASDAEQHNYPKPTSKHGDEFDRKRARKEKPDGNDSRSMSRGNTRSYNQSHVEHSFEGQVQWADVNSDDESFCSVATRERLAFGIPPSESDEMFRKDLGEPELSHADSNMSSINETIWKEAQYEDEMDTKRVLRKLRDKNIETAKGRIRKHVQDATPRLNIISPTLSAESLTYEERKASSAVNQGSRSEMAEPNLRTMPPSTKEDIGHHEFMETREGVIQEIFETEEDLLCLLRICMRLFIIPLRVQNSRTWITGVPPTVARLLDWFDDIVHLHEQIYGALCSARDTMSPATDRVSESLRWFVLRIEVYQPYLVRLADARAEIRRALEDQKSELGQFIRLQEMHRECQGWTLERLLTLPVNRLANFQDLFARMLDLTSKIHQDYLSTLSLSRSTDIALKVMTEVKAREDEYSLLKEFSARIQGLPTQNLLATRDRRLLHSGPLQLVISNLNELSGRTNGSLVESKRISRSSKLLDAIAKSPDDFGKSSGSSWITNGNDDGSTISASSPSKMSWFSRLPLRRRSRAKSPLPITDETARTAPGLDLRTVDVHAFVFNDLVLLVQQRRSDVSEHSWILSEDVGIFRPLSIARLKRRSAQGILNLCTTLFTARAMLTITAEGMILSLEVATVDPMGLNDTFNFRSSSWRIVDLLLPPPPSRGVLDDQVDANSNDHFQPWLNSLRQCSKHILRKLTFISHQGGSSFFGSDRLLDTHLVVSSLTASGLPVPRSPSGNLPETSPAGSDRAPGSSDEREERGWWSLRYQQVFREFERQDSGLLDDEEED